MIDVFSRFILGWNVSSFAPSDFVLDALEQALNARKPVGDLIHHRGRGVQDVFICYTERLADAGIEASVGSVGDSYDNTLAETINGLYKAEVIFVSHGKTGKPLISKHWSGWAGSTIADY